MKNTNTSDQVHVLLSTYNGDAYLNEQLKSIYDQTYPNIQIIVRDDGSSDLTLELLEKEVSKNRLILQSSESNLGPAVSFFNLLESSGEAGFFAFCDQDDIWNNDKIERAVMSLQAISNDIPAMYFSALECVDEKNQFIKQSPSSMNVGFGNAIVENIATGCTVVLNKRARDLIVKSLPNQCLMHDAWCYLVISCLGQVLFDEHPSMRYRQHSNNAIGAATSVWNNFSRRIKRFKLFTKDVFRFSNQANSFLELYGDEIPREKKQLIVEFVNAKPSLLLRIRLAFNSKIWRQSAIDNLILRLLILMNKY